MYHSADSQPLTGDANVILHVHQLPRHVYNGQSECFFIYFINTYCVGSSKQFGLVTNLYTGQLDSVFFETCQETDQYSTLRAVFR